MSRYVVRRRIKLGLKQIEVAVPQIHEPGAEAEVDFGEFGTHIDRGWATGRPDTQRHGTENQGR